MNLLKQRLAVAVLLASCAGVANASTAWSFTFDGTTAGNNTSPSPVYGNNRSFSNAGVSAQATAWAGTKDYYSATNTVGTNTNLMDIESAYLAVYGTNGLGVVNRDGATVSNSTVVQTSSSVVQVTSSVTNAQDGNEYIGGSTEHAMDNDGRYDAILFSFEDEVALQSLKLGWVNTDADVTVLAWTGGPSGPTMGAGTSVDFKAIGTTNSGWSLVSNTSAASSGVINTTTETNAAKALREFNKPTAPGTTPVYSNYWLIGAGAFSQTSTGAGMGTGDAYKDLVKLASIGGIFTPPPPPPSQGVPEPGSLALAGAALLGLLHARRRKAG